MMERKQLEEAIAALEGKRGILGDAVIEKALAPLRQRFAELDAEVKTDFDAALQPTTPHIGERRVITVLFCDVKGSTAIAEKLDPEEWAGIIQPALEYLIKPVNHHGGIVAQVMGDGILALFGAPVTHEDDPQRAVIAGLEILEGIRIFQEPIKRTRGLDFNVRVGIHTGLAVVGEVGLEDQKEYTAIGDAVNLAARMEQTAQPGTVQISAQTYGLVEQIFECESLGEIKVKGKSKPIQAYRVLGLKLMPSPMRGLERQGIHSSLVGREAEFTALRECIQRLLSGQGGVVGIIGEAGIGKSRLLLEIQNDVLKEPLDWLEGNTISFGQTISYWPFQEILRHFATISKQDGDDAAWRKLEGQIATLFPENAFETAPTVADILPYLASLLTLPVRGDYLERVKYLDSEALGKQIFLAARHFFERLASTRPVVLVFEDLHWMDESSVSLLEHLLPLVERLPLLIIGLSRPYQKTPASLLRDAITKEYSAYYTEIQLAPLSQIDSKQLVHNLLEEDLSGVVCEMILSKAEGNPFFLEEILRVLIDLGTIQRDTTSGCWRALAQIENLTIPNTVQGVILSRLDRLEVGAKQVLRVASVIGRNFLHRVLEAVAEAGESLDEYLAELVYLALIQEKQHVPEVEYLFKHALAQETVYESILLQKRRDLHSRVGEALETLFADRLEEFYGLLAHHYARAEVWEKAQAYLLKAAEQAGRMAADAEALAHYRQALAAYERAFGEQWDPIQRAALERKIGEALFRRGEHAQAIDHMRRALAYLGRPLPASQGGMRITILREIVRQIGHRLRIGFVYPNSAKPIIEAIEEEERTYESLLWIAGVNPEDLFLFVALRMLNFSEKNGFLPGAIIGFSAFALILDFMALPHLAQYYGQKALDLAGQSRHAGAVSSAYTFRAMHENMQCRWNSVRECAQHAIEVQRQSGYWNPRIWALSVMNLADAYIHQGEFALALASSQELIQFGQESADRQAWCWGLSRLGYAQHGMGKLDESIRSLLEAMDLARLIPDYQTYVDSGGELGKNYLDQGRLEQAFSVFEDCQRQSLEHNLRRSPVITRFINGIAEAYLLAAEQYDGVDKKSNLKMASHACQEALKQGKAYQPGMPEAMMLKGRYEWLSGNRRAAKKWWQRSVLMAERIGVRYDLGRAYFEIGQRLGESNYLAAAEAIFAQIGAGLYLEK